MNSQATLVSICVPIYGVEKYIGRCATSLFEQTYENIEYIFINDCTPDKSIEVLKQIISKYPSKKDTVRIINHERNRGLAAARNTAIDNCKGEFLLHVDSDDYIEFDAVEKLIAKQQENDADIVSGSYITHHSKKDVITKCDNHFSPKEMCLLMLSQKINYNIWGRLIRIALYKENNVRTKEGCNMSEDYSVTPILAYYARRINVIDDIIYHYDFTNPGSYVKSFSAVKSKQTWTVFNLLQAFFVNKGDEYKHSLELAKIRILSRHLFSCCSDGKDKEYYRFLREEQKKTKKEDYKIIERRKRVLLIVKNWTLAKLLVRLMWIAKKVVDIFH